MNFSEKLEDTQKEIGADSMSCNIREKFSQKSTGTISAMNDQNSEFQIL